MKNGNWELVFCDFSSSKIWCEGMLLHKVVLMFRVYILFNTAQLAGGGFHLSVFGGAGHLSVLMVILLLHINNLGTTPLWNYFKKI